MKEVSNQRNVRMRAKDQAADAVAACVELRGARRSGRSSGGDGNSSDGCGGNGRSSFVANAPFAVPLTVSGTVPSEVNFDVEVAGMTL